MHEGDLQFQLCPLDVTNITMTIQAALQGEMHREASAGMNAHSVDTLAKKMHPQQAQR